jgi:ribosome biogenesis GTPase
MKQGKTEKAVCESKERIARVIRVDRGLYHLAGAEGVFLAEVKGSFLMDMTSAADYPAVGDYVKVDRVHDRAGHGMIEGLLPRKSFFSRKVAGNRLDVQVVAANVDKAYICMALNDDFNLRRLERYLTQAWSSGAEPAVLLTKLDLCGDSEDRIRQVEAVAIGVAVFAVSALTGQGMAAWKDSLRPGQTGVLLGSSGVGKSTLTNALLGEDHLLTQGLRNDDKGRHTTTYRELVALENGAFLIDTPGMRELQLLDDQAASGSVFREIEALAGQCRFRDCSHRGEPGCAVQAAIEAGDLSRVRWESYQKILKEQRFMEAKAKERDRQAKKKKGKRRN